MYSAFRSGSPKRKSVSRKSSRKSSPKRKSSPRRSVQVGGAAKKARGSRSSVARGGAKATGSGLSLGHGLFRDKKDGRIKSSKVSKLSKARFQKSPALKARAQAVKAGFAAVKKARKTGQKINSPAVMKAPLDAVKNPSKYLK